jgi:hypothetical protein
MLDPYRALLQEVFPNLKLAPTIWEVDIDYHKPSEKWASGFHAAAGVLAFLGATCGLAWCLFMVWPAERSNLTVRAGLQPSFRECSADRQWPVQAESMQSVAERGGRPRNPLARHTPSWSSLLRVH